jgi:sugar lactone lactonase YvrE
MPHVEDAPAARQLVARRRTADVCEHGEGPVWDARDGVLHAVDMMRGDVVTFDPREAASQGEDGRFVRRHLSSVVAALRPRRAGGWVLALEHEFARTEPGSWRVEPIAEAITDPGVRFNDGGCDAAGGFLCGSMAYDYATGAGTLFRLAPDGTVTRVLEDVSISNGFCLDPTGRLAYYADTPSGRVDVFDVGADGHSLSGRRTFVAIEPGAGLPDGLTVDAEGGLWVALYGTGTVRHYLADGRLEAVVHVPTPVVTACAFGGDDLRELFITTSQEHLEPGSDPLAGALFSVDPGVAGLPPRMFAG